jgi:hypothetical protein
MPLILKIFLFLSPFPLFLDGADLSVFLYFPPPGDLDAMQNTKPAMPLPLVLLANTVLLFGGIINAVGRNLGLKKICSSCWRSTLAFCIVQALVFNLMGVSLITFFQMYLAVLLMSLTVIIYNRLYLANFAKAYLYGLTVWLFLHAFSMLFYNDFSPVGIDRASNFATFFGVYIYQSLVSYAATISVFVIFSIFMYFETNAKKTALFALMLSSFVGFVSETRLFVLDYFLVIFIFLLFHKTTKSKLSFRKGKTFLFVVVLSFIAFGVTNYTNRFVSMGSEDRFTLISQALGEILGNSSLIFWGAGLKHSYAHNFFLDFILNYGLLNLLLSMLLVFYIFFEINKYVRLSPNGPIYIAMLGLVTMTNSFFNSAITQPLFFGNVFLAYIIILSSMERRNTAF